MNAGYKSVCAVAVLSLLCVAGPAYALFDNVDEEALGRKADKEIIKAFGLYDDDKIQAYVRSVGKKVLSAVSDPEFDFHFKVVDSGMVNAFALPGGYIYVTRGLLAVIDSEAELAGVLGHETGHVVGHHSTKMMKKSIAQALLALGGLAASEDVRKNAGAWLSVTTSLSQQIMLGYGREMETEADQVGMLLSYESGYSPDGVVRFLKALRTMEKQGGQSFHGFQATHPETVSRIIEAEGKSALLKARDKKLKFARDNYLDNIKGLRYGKPQWRGQTLPPYRIEIHIVKEGETFRSIARDISGDETLALETATLNHMGHNQPLKPGRRIKALALGQSVYSALDGKNVKKKKKETKDEIGAGTGNGKNEQNGGEPGAQTY